MRLCEYNNNNIKKRRLLLLLLLLLLIPLLTDWPAGSRYKQTSSCYILALLSLIQEVKNERFLIWIRQNNVRIFGKCCLRQSDNRTNRQPILKKRQFFYLLCVLVFFCHSFLLMVLAQSLSVFHYLFSRTRQNH